MDKPYGQNEGDLWTAGNSELQQQISSKEPGMRLLVTIKGGEEAVFTTHDPELIAEAEEGNELLGTVLCPRCRRDRYTPYVPGLRTRYAPPALSRMDNSTYICSDCGQAEAMRDFEGLPPIPPSEWPVNWRPEFGIGRDVRA